MQDLFGNNTDKEVIRTLGFYQPFCSLMLHGKIETRWVQDGKKPPFPLGKYVLYSTLKPCHPDTVLKWCGEIIANEIDETLENDKTVLMNGQAICIGDLVEVRPLKEYDLSFVKFIGKQTFIKKRNGVDVPVLCKQWALVFNNVQRIEPFDIKGKQGVGFFKQPELIETKQ